MDTREPDREPERVGLAAPALRGEPDHYIDPSGLLVFTEAYHLKRGYCCGSGCRHCPWPEKPTGQPKPGRLKKEALE